MKRFLPLIIALSAVLPAGLRAADPTNIDPAKQNSALAPSSDTTDMPLSTRREDNQRPVERNDRVQDRRFNTPDKIERKEAPVGDRRAPIDIEETREKNIIDRKDVPKPEVKTYDQNRYDQQRSLIQPKGDQLKTYDKVDKYQSRMKDADTVFSRQPKMEKRTTFDKLNRFIFKRNGPGSDEDNPVVTTAGGGSTPPASQDTYTKYKVDWNKGRVTPETP